jgi:hypothetical protein
MTVVLFNHSRVGVPKVLSHDEERHARHGGETGPRVTQAVEADWRSDLLARPAASVIGRVCSDLRQSRPLFKKINSSV